MLPAYHVAGRGNLNPTIEKNKKAMLREMCGYASSYMMDEVDEI
jgi:hypothetical protein